MMCGGLGGRKEGRKKERKKERRKEDEKYQNFALAWIQIPCAWFNIFMEYNASRQTDCSSSIVSSKTVNQYST